MSEHLPDYETEPARSAYHDALPVGERLSAQPLLESPFFGFEGDLRMKPLEPMLVPERPRSGVEDPSACFHCGPGLEHAIWADEHWHVGAAPDTGLPFVAGLAPNAHVRLDEMDAGAARHVRRGRPAARRGDPGPRRAWPARTSPAGATAPRTSTSTSWPARSGMMQGRGPMLAFWDDVLPRVDADLLAAHRRQVAAAMAEGGGTSRL